ncbi:MAG: GAF domain-containing protein, partial [Pseudomonadales bacterium]|nr:GAF domain-containing protein [Pseudomonadales bacterium]
MPLAKKNVVIHQQEYFWRLVDVARAVSSAKDIDRLCEGILREAQSVSNADAGSILLLKGVGVDSYLEFAVIKNDSLNIIKQQPSEFECFHNIPLYDSEGKPNDKNIASYCALNKTTVNIADAYCIDVFDFSGTKRFDKNTGYRTQSVLTVALKNHDDEIMGVLQLLNSQEPSTGLVSPFRPEVQIVVEALASLVALSIENRMLLREHRDLLVRLSTEPTTSRLFERIVREAQLITFAEGGTLYLVSGEGKDARLDFAVVKNEVLDFEIGGDEGEPVDLQPLYLYKQDGSKNLTNVATFSALKRHTVNIQDAGEA